MGCLGQTGILFIANDNIFKYSSEKVLGNKPHSANSSTHFGSKSIRFSGGFFQSKEGPGPGEYIQEKLKADVEPIGILTKAQINNRGKGGSVFKSTTNRFVQNEPKNPSVQILDKKPDGTNDLIIYNIKQQINKADDNKYKGMLKPTLMVGFTATSPRFTHNQVFYGERLKYTPGPGDYVFNKNERPKTHSQSRGKSRKHGFNSRETKFNRGNISYISSRGTAQIIGPGSYISTECTMIKKSYNMSME